MPAPEKLTPDKPVPVRRHSLLVRLTHWLNLWFLTVLLMSGLQIFNAHPSLYWGHRSDEGTAWLAIRPALSFDHPPHGETEILGRTFDTTGVLGFSRNAEGDTELRAFPAWATLPGPQWLAMGRRWHLFFAWLLVLNAAFYVLYSLASRHLSRDLWPHARDWRALPRSILDHLPGRRGADRMPANTADHATAAEPSATTLNEAPAGEVRPPSPITPVSPDAGSPYNPLQKLAYVGVIFVLGPLIVLSGLAMSPRLDAAYPWLPELFGGRQSARSVHFLTVVGLIGFVLVHVFMVLVSGPVNLTRSMITGRYRPKRGAGAR